MFVGNGRKIVPDVAGDRIRRQAAAKVRLEQRSRHAKIVRREIAVEKIVCQHNRPHLLTKPVGLGPGPILVPDKREKDPVLGNKLPGVIDRTTGTSGLKIQIGYLPEPIKASRDLLDLLVPVFDQVGLEIGPIPAGTAVDLLANFDPLPSSNEPLDDLTN